MKNARPLWQRDEDETTGDSIERLLARRDYRTIADSLDEDSVLPKELLKDDSDRITIAALILPLVLQPDDAYWYVERFVPSRRRAPRGEFRAVDDDTVETEAVSMAALVGAS
jgi:hypothetical protein